MASKVTLKQLTELKNENKFVFVDFFAPWCGECKMVEPIISRIIKQYSNVQFYGVDVDQENVWSDDGNSEYSIDKVPTFIFFIDGKEVDRIENFQTEQSLKKFIEKNIN